MFIVVIGLLGSGKFFLVYVGLIFKLEFIGFLGLGEWFILDMCLGEIFLIIFKIIFEGDLENFFEMVSFLL